MRLAGLVTAIALAALGGCFADTPMVGDETTTTAASTGSSCERGSVGCTCFPNGTCDAGLSCDAGLCMPLEPTGADGSASTTSDSTGSSSDSAGSSSGSTSDSAGSSSGTTSTAGSSSGDSTTGTTGPAHVLFTTSSSYTGLEVGGLAGADDICDTLGQGVRAGPWVAVLRDAVNSLESRVTIQGDVVNIAGELLATDEVELLSGMLQSIPGYDETGAEVPSQDLVWTGSETNDCVGWTVDDFSFSGAAGLPSDAELWLDTGIPLPCSASPRLYCISQ